MSDHAHVPRLTERLLAAAVGSGALVDRTSGDPAQDDPARGPWGEDRTVAADLLVELLTRERLADGERPRAVRLRGARIVGDLDLAGRELVCPLELERCDVEGALALDGATAVGVSLWRCRIAGDVSAIQLTTRGSVTLSHLLAERLLLMGARIDGGLDVSGCRLASPSGWALHADGIDVKQNVFAQDGFAAAGGVSMIGAHVAGELNLAGARLDAAAGPALNAADLRVEKGLVCRELRAHGEVRLTAAHLGALNLDGAELTGSDGRALSAERSRIEHGVTATGLSASGEVRFARAHVGGLWLDGARLSASNRPALAAPGIEVDNDMACGKGFVAHGAVMLIGAHIRGQLRLAGAHLVNPRGTSLSADWLRVDGALFAGHPDARGDAVVSEGLMRLLGAVVSGQLLLAGARLSCGHDLALLADSLQVNGGMFCQELSADGGVSLIGARVTGELNLTGAALTNGGGAALSADGLEVALGLLCGDGFTARGELSLIGARVGHRCVLSGAQLHNRGRVALAADRLHVDGLMSCGALVDRATGRRVPGLVAEGEVALVGAHVTGQLGLDQAMLDGGDGPALNARRLTVDQDLACERVVAASGTISFAQARVGGDLRLAGTRVAGGTLDLSGAGVGRLLDGWEAGDPPPYRPSLAGFRYEALADRDDLRARLDWLGHADEGFLPAGYDWLSAVLRRSGREPDAREAAIARFRRRRDELPPPVRWLSRFVDVAVGYGYHPWRSGLGLLALIAGGWLVFALASFEHLRPSRPPAQLPEFAPWLYAIDAVLPVINLGQESAWSATGYAQIWYAISVLAGWILATILVATLTARLVRD